MRKLCMLISAAALFGFVGSALAAPGGTTNTGPLGNPGDHKSCKAWGTGLATNIAQNGNMGDYVRGWQAINDPVGQSGHGVWQPNHAGFCDPS